LKLSFLRGIISVTGYDRASF